MIKQKQQTLFVWLHLIPACRTSLSYWADATPPLQVAQANGGGCTVFFQGKDDPSDGGGSGSAVRSKSCLLMTDITDMAVLQQSRI